MKCLTCYSVYSDQLRRCPSCGEAPAGQTTAQRSTSEPQPRAHASRAYMRRLILVAVTSAVVGVGLVLAIPRADSDKSASDDEDSIVVSHAWKSGPVVLPSEIEPVAVGEGFAIVGVEPWRDQLLVTGTCTDTAVRILVNRCDAVIAPDGRHWSALVPRDDERIEAIAQGLGDDLASRSSSFAPSSGEKGPWSRLLNVADGSTLHESTVELELASASGTERREVELFSVENRIRAGRSDFSLYRAPLGLVFLRVTPRGTYSFLREIDGQEMVLVPGGVGRRGDGAAPPHGPAHFVRLAPFLVDRTEVTGRQYAAFLRYMGRVNDVALRHPQDPGVPLRPVGWDSDEPPASRADLPVTGVDWFCAFAYARWVGGSLPTEAQWERAAAGAQGLAYPWGETFDAARCRATAQGPVAADSMPAGESPYGVLHASGNVREWCDDRFDPRWYVRSVRTNPRGPTRAKHRVVRGGSFATPYAALSVRFRDHLDPGQRAADVGFRVVRRWVQSSENDE